MFRIENVNGRYADIVEDKTGSFIFTQYYFQETPVEGIYSLGEKVDSFPIKRVLKLKEAGFDTEEIIQLLKEI